MHYNEYHERLLAEFDRLLASHGRGTLARLQRSLGLSRSYFSQWNQGAKISMTRLLQALEFLGEDAFGFLARAMRPDEVTEFDLEFIRRKTKKAQPSYKTPAAKEVREIIENGPSRLPACADDAGSRSIEDLLGQIERLRYSDPKASLQLAKRVASEASIVDLARALGEWASSLKTLGRLDEAEEVLQIAMGRIGVGRESRALMADLTRRRSYIETNRGRLSEAIRAADHAIHLSSSVRDLKGVGRGFASRGSATYNLGLYDNSNDDYLAALTYLDETLDVVAIQINMAQNWQKLGDFTRRDKCLRIATDCKDIPLGMANELGWMRAEYELIEGRFEQAASRFSGLIEKYWQLGNSIDAALATCLAVEARFRNGHLAEAEALIKKMPRFLIPLEKNEIVSVAIRDLITQSLGYRQVIGKAAISHCIESLRQAAARLRPQP